MVSWALLPYTISQILAVCLNERTNLNLTPYARRFLKDEPNNLKFYLDDGLSRKSLTYGELLQSILIVRSFRPVSIDPTIPILILRGQMDRVCSDQSVKKFLQLLNTDNLSIYQSSTGGHLLLQALEIDEYLIDAVFKWIDEVIERKHQTQTT